MRKRVISGIIALLMVVSLLPMSALAQNNTSQQDEYEPPIAKSIDEAADILVKSLWEHYVRTEIRWDKNAAAPTPDLVDAIMERAKQKSGDYPFGEATVYGGVETADRGDSAADWQIVYICRYYITDEQNTQLSKRVDEVLQSLDITDNSSDYDVIRAIYDYVCANVTYDYANLPNDDYKLKYTAYAALINKTAVCNGYTMLMSRMLTQAGISCRMILGDKSSGCDHAWNIVEIDGIYYNLDATWDAGTSPEKYDYFLRGENDFDNHIASDVYSSDEFMRMYPMAESRYIECPSHSFGEWTAKAAATCTELGVETRKCRNCGRLEGRHTPALGHSYGAWTQTKAPTCTAKGTETGRCTRCNASETRDVAALGHDIIPHAAKAATCTEKGWAAYDTCSRCDYTTYEEIPALGHSYANGKCTRCGAADPNYKPAPKAPELKITTSAGKPKIYWNSVDGAAKYWIYRSTDGKNFKYYDSTTKTSYTNGSTNVGTTYYYKVKTVKVVNGKSYTSDFSISKGIQCKPAAPTVSINRSNGKPKLSWKAVSGAKKYWIYRSTDGKNFKYFDSTTKTSYTNSGAASGTKYYYRVKAVAVVNGKNVVSANSSTKSLLTSLAKPSVSITTSNGKPKLTWKAVTGADKYYVYRSTDGKNFKYWDSTTKTTYINSGAKKNTKYYYKVKAVCASNSNANSAQSSAVSIKATK